MIVLSFRLAVVAQPLVSCVVFCRCLSLVFFFSFLLLSNNWQTKTKNNDMLNTTQVTKGWATTGKRKLRTIICKTLHRLLKVGSTFSHLCSVLADHCPYFSFASCCSTFSHLCSVLQIIVLSFCLSVVAQPLVTCVVFSISLFLVLVCQLLLNLYSPV
jgi:hypothetical protein